MKKYMYSLMMIVVGFLLVSCQSTLDLTSFSLDGDHITYDASSERYEIDGDITLLETYEGFDITWESQNTDYLTNDGIVTRPEAGVNVSFQLIAHINQQSKAFYVRIVPNDIMNLDTLNIAGSELTYLQQSSLYETTADLNLPETYLLHDITWESSDETHLTNDGIITRPRDGNDVIVTLTAYVMTLEKSFSIRIKSGEIDQTLLIQGTYQLLYDIDSTKNSYALTDIAETYASYALEIDGLIATITYQLTGSQETVTDTFELIKVSDYLYKNLDNDWLVYVDVDYDYAEFYHMTDTSYEGFILTGESFTGFKMNDEQLYYDLDRSSLSKDTFDADTYFDMVYFGITNMYNYAVFYLGTGPYDYVISGYASITEHFIVLENNVYYVTFARQQENIHYVTDVEYQLDGTYIDKSFHATLVKDQQTFSIADLDDTASESIEQLLSSELVFNGNRYEMYGKDYTSGYMINDFVDEAGLLHADNFYGYAYMYEDPTVDIPNAYIKYELNDTLTEATEINIFDYYTQYPSIDKILQMNATYAYHGEDIFLITSVYELQRNFSLFGYLDFTGDVYIQVSIEDQLIVLDFYDEDSTYFSSLVYEEGYQLDFNFDDVKTSGANDYSAALKPIELGETYEVGETSSERHIYRLSVDAGIYAFDYTNYVEIVDEAGEPLDIEKHYSVNYMSYYIVVDEPFDAFLLIEDNTSYTRTLKVYEIEDIQETSLNFVPDEAIVIDMLESVYDKASLTVSATENTVYKLVFENDSDMAVISYLKDDNQYSTSTHNEYIVDYLSIEAGQTMTIDVYANGILYMYLLEDISPANDAENPYVLTDENQALFANSMMYEKDYYTYTLESGSVDFTVMGSGDSSIGDFTFDETSLYDYGQTFLKVYNENDELVSLPLTEPGTYQIIVEPYMIYGWYYLEMTHTDNVHMTFTDTLDVSMRYDPLYETTYSFVLSEKSYVEIDTTAYGALQLVDMDTNRILWLLEGNYVITLAPGSYMITVSKNANYAFDYELKVDVLGVSEQIPFNQYIRYSYPEKLNITLTYDNELIRLEFYYHEYMYYNSSKAIVFGVFNDEAMMYQMDNNTFSSYLSQTYENDVNIYFITAEEATSLYITFRTLD